MMVNPVSATTYTYPVAGISGLGQTVNAVSKINGVSPVEPKSTNTISKVSPSECQTCKSRKYMDVSNDANVSFQTPTHISPGASYAAVSSHEQEHVSNAVSEGSQPGKQLVSSSVTLKMAVCPECGTPYVAGGVTNTVMRSYENTSNPYESSRKSLEGSVLRGMNFDQVA